MWGMACTMDLTKVPLPIQERHLHFQVSRARPEHNLFKLAQNTIFEPNKIKSFFYLFYDSINEGWKTWTLNISIGITKMC